MCGLYKPPDLGGLGRGPRGRPGEYHRPLRAAEQLNGPGHLRRVAERFPGHAVLARRVPGGLGVVNFGLLEVVRDGQVHRALPARQSSPERLRHVLRDALGGRDLPGAFGDRRRHTGLVELLHRAAPQVR